MVFSFLLRYVRAHGQMKTKGANNALRSVPQADTAGLFVGAIATAAGMCYSMCIRNIFKSSDIIIIHEGNAAMLKHL